MLSAQTTDVNVNRVTVTLFEKYRRPGGLPRRPTGGVRARHLRDRLLPSEGEGDPRDDAQCCSRSTTGRCRASTSSCAYPGVARKTANVVAAELGEPQGVVVDTHVRRISQRLGFTREDDPVKIERDLLRLVPREHWGIFPHLLIWHGRRVCIARAPRCEDCVLTDLCPASRVYPRARAGDDPAAAPRAHGATRRVPSTRAGLLTASSTRRLPDAGHA